MTLRSKAEWAKIRSVFARRVPSAYAEVALAR
jgi:hypothetical protein